MKVVVGCGRYARAVHIPYLQRSQNADIVGTIDPDPYVDIETINAPHSYDTETILPFLNDVDADGVIISTPPHTRLDIYDQIFGEPYHIHIDKPFLTPRTGQSPTTYKETYHNYVEQAKQHPLPVSIHSQRRFDSFINHCKNALKSTYNKAGIIPQHIYYEGTDGNLRTNHEWANDEYHSLNRPLGILEHSYYHYIDTYAHMIQHVTIKDIATSTNCTTLNDIQAQNNLATKQILRTTTNANRSSPVSIDVTHRLTTTNDETLAFTTHISHLGTTTRTEKNTKHYEDNRYSQKHLHIHAGSTLSAHYSSTPRDLQSAHVKQDRLKLTNALQNSSDLFERERTKKLDAKRQATLAAFIQGYETGADNPSSLAHHDLTHELYLDAALNVLQ